MGLDPKSQHADSVGNLYRSALFMVKGNTDLSIIFLQKAYLILKEKISAPLVELLVKKGKRSKEEQFFWAEKILDQYQLLKRG